MQEKSLESEQAATELAGTLLQVIGSPMFAERIAYYRALQEKDAVRTGLLQHPLPEARDSGRGTG